MTEQNRKSFSGKAPTGFQCRYLVAIMSVMNSFMANAIRTNLSVAMTAMVNSTKTDTPTTGNNSRHSCVFEAEFNVTQMHSPHAGEFHWSPEIQGFVLSGIFLGYVFGTLPAGCLVQKYGGKRIMVLGMVLAAVCHILTPFAAHAHSYCMIAIQLLSGFGQGSSLPSFAVLSSNWFPKSERGTFNCLYMSGFAIGSAIAGNISSFICNSVLLGGWTTSFYIFGSAAMLLALWIQICMNESPKSHPTIKTSELLYILTNQETELPLKRPPTPWGKILTSLPVLAAIMAVFSQTWISAHVISLQVPFVGQVLKLSLQKSGLYNSLSFVISALFGIAASFLPSWLNRRGYVGVQKSRKGCTFIANFGYSAGLLAVSFVDCDRDLINILLMFAMGFFGMGFGGALITPMDMSPMFAGSVSSLFTIFGTSAAFIFPLVAGKMTNKDQSLDQWHKIFYICIGIATSTALFYCAFGSAEIQAWNFPEGFQRKRSANGHRKSASSNGEKDSRPELKMNPEIHL